MSNQKAVGFGKPPTTSRFQKGKSGNPRGRPKNRHREIPYDAVLGQMVTIREDGRERRVTAAEAFLLQLTQKGLAGDSAAARASLEAIESARAVRGDDANQINVIVLKFVGNGANSILDDMSVTKVKFASDDARVRREINPWMVEAALARLSEKRLRYTFRDMLCGGTHATHDADILRDRSIWDHADSPNDMHQSPVSN